MKHSELIWTVERKREVFDAIIKALWKFSHINGGICPDFTITVFDKDGVPHSFGNRRQLLERRYDEA